MDVLQITEKDISKLVEVHNSAFQNFFLTDLGSSFLHLYYKSVLKSPEGILIGAFDNGELIGFCAACCKSANFNSKLIKSNLFKFSLMGFKLLLTKPKAIIRLIKNLTKSNGSNDKGDYAELLSIAVSKQVQNSGAGKAMLNILESILKGKSIELLSLTTDKENNHSTLCFYIKCGFNEMYSFIAYPNRPMYRLIKNIS